MSGDAIFGGLIVMVPLLAAYLHGQGKRDAKQEKTADDVEDHETRIRAFEALAPVLDERSKEMARNLEYIRRWIDER